MHGHPPRHPDAVSSVFSVQQTLKSLVSVRTTIPEDAMTAAHLGTERTGHGVIIGEEGLVLTIGYVVTEADSVWIIDADDVALPGHVVGYDQESGFGLVQAFGQLAGRPIPFGDSKSLSVGQSMYLCGAGGESQCLKVDITALREFAGYWEYLLDTAIFTSPVHPAWGGAALIDETGKLCGIGSLILQAVGKDGTSSDESNMVIPINLLTPILGDLMQTGQRLGPARPWMGWFVQETGQGLMVMGLSDNGPADAAGIRVGDIVHEIDNTRILDLAMLYRHVWNTGSAGVEIQVTVECAAGHRVVVVKSVDRGSRLVGANLH